MDSHRFFPSGPSRAPRSHRGRVWPCLGAALLLLLAGPAQAREELGCDHLPRLFRTFLQKHITYNHLNKELRIYTDQ